MTQIRSIRSLQALGLTLKEVAEYYYDTENIETHLQRLMDLRATLDRNIQRLQVCSAKRGDLTVQKTSLPRQTCFWRRYPCRDTKEAANNLRDTYQSKKQPCVSLFLCSYHFIQTHILFEKRGCAFCFWNICVKRSGARGCWGPF